MRASTPVGRDLRGSASQPDLRVPRFARCSPVLAVILTADASAIGGNEARDIRVVCVRPVPVRAFIADEVARRGVVRTAIDA